MKNYRTTTLLSGACAIALAAATAHGQDSRFYVRADVGGTVMNSTRVKQFFGSVDPGTKLRFDPGVRIGFVGGYQLNDYIALEGETGVSANTIHSVTGGDVHNATYSNIPFLANLRLEVPARGPVTPFIGGGLGGSAAGISCENGHMDLNGTRLTGNDETVVFAYQAFAGLRFDLNRQMSICLEYHYFATTGPTWTANEAFGTDTDRLRFAGVTSHAVSAAFNFRF
jgi:opacity protein-like surface antigen